MRHYRFNHGVPVNNIYVVMSCFIKICDNFVKLFSDFHFRGIPMSFSMVVVIYSTAGTQPKQNDYSHGSHFPCHKKLYTRLPCIKYKSVNYTTAVSHPKSSYTRLPCIKYKSDIYTATVSHAKCFIHGCHSSRGERGGLVVNASDSGSRGRGLEPHSGPTVLCP